VRLLLDTHTLFWSVEDPSKVSAPGMTAMTAMKDPANDRLLSAATIWELAIKVGQGKITLAMPYRKWMETAIADLEKDPFDRLMIAQALVEKIAIVSTDVAFDVYGVTRIW
jgi:PIN domain nuclease of toxin-antitoxin system